MAQNTRISWADNTLNFWEGCTKVSAGCKNCYMYDLLRRLGRDPTRVARTSAATWRQPRRWNRRAGERGVRETCFTCSLSDFWHPDADPWRPEAWRVMRECPHLIFLLLTKRPERIADYLPADWGGGWPNCWVGVTVEANEYVGRADVLRRVPAVMRFVSAEPLLGPLPGLDLSGVGWLIVGGESGPNYRHMDHGWARQLRDAAEAAGTAFFFKQSSAVLPGRGDTLDGVEHKRFPLTIAEPIL